MSVPYLSDTSIAITGFQIFPLNLRFSYFISVPNASMCPSSNGFPGELEKFPNADTSMPIAEPLPPDAGMRSSTHCPSTHLIKVYNFDFFFSALMNTLLTRWADKRRLPQWRYSLRQRLLPLVRVETPYLAWMQDRMRSPALDSYFAITANLGTHTFFMTALPILFWCGHTSLGRG